MNCGEVRDLMLEADGRLDRLDVAARAHVDGCAGCAREGELLRRFADSARRAKAVAPPGFTLRVMEKVHAEAEAARPLWRKIADLFLAPRLAPALGMAMLLLLACAVFLLSPGDRRTGDQAALGHDPVAPKSVPAPQDPSAVAHVEPAPKPVEAVDFSFAGKPLAYAVAHSFRKGQVVDYRGGLAAVEIVEDANLMFVEGQLQLVDGVVSVASREGERCPLVAATDTLRVTMLGTVFELGCRGGLSHCLVLRGAVEILTGAGENFSLLVGDSVHVGPDGARIAPSVGASEEPPAGAAAAANQAAPFDVVAATERALADATVEVHAVPAGTEAVPVRTLLDQLQNQGIK